MLHYFQALVQFVKQIVYRDRLANHGHWRFNQHRNGFTVFSKHEIACFSGGRIGQLIDILKARQSAVGGKISFIGAVNVEKMAIVSR